MNFRQSALANWILIGLFAALPAACNLPTQANEPAESLHNVSHNAPVQLNSLEELSIESLRARTYHSKIKLESRLTNAETLAAVPSSERGQPAQRQQAFIASYQSDGLRIYSRIDVPTAPPGPTGYPVVIFVHGWVGQEAAPSFDFYRTPDSLYGQMISAYTEAGFIVLTPALRGHGTVNGISAEGIEFLEAWDNGSYISPIFYAIDVLNLLEGVHTLEDIDWTSWGAQDNVPIDLNRLNISGHSQGGDAVLTALAVSGEHSGIRNTLASGSIISGCFGPRFEQVEIYGPMANTLQAFMSGDGSWTGTAIGRDGRVNPDFVFAYPSDWIGTVDPNSPDWTWQADIWSIPSVKESIRNKYAEMYSAINHHVLDLAGAEFEIGTGTEGKTVIRHDPRVSGAMNHIGGFNFEQFLTEPVHLHHSDRDYYSIPRWNKELAARINRSGGSAVNFEYAGNNHSLKISEHDWFSDGEVVEGMQYMIGRDTSLFLTGKVSPAEIPSRERLSISGLRQYADTMQNEFSLAHKKDPIDGIKRRVVGFKADGLKQYALVLEPTGPMPSMGWPVLVMNHGFHPDPPNYGRLDDGSTDRPGDYYRGLPLAFAKAGFLVIAPDFRGHNISHGLDFTRLTNPQLWYARDVIAAFRALSSLPGADIDNVFMWGHSMGSSITLRVVLALGERVRGASLWSSSEDIDPALHPLPLNELNTPLIIRHAMDDQVTNSEASRRLHTALLDMGKPNSFYALNGADHLFADQDRKDSVSVDSTFFRSLAERAAME